LIISKNKNFEYGLELELGNTEKSHRQLLEENRKLRQRIETLEEKGPDSWFLTLAETTADFIFVADATGEMVFINV